MYIYHIFGQPTNILFIYSSFGKGENTRQLVQNLLMWKDIYILTLLHHWCKTFRYLYPKCVVYSYGNAETLFHWLDNFGLRRTPFDRVLLDEMLGYVDIHTRRIVLCSCSILVTVVKWKHLYFGNDYPCYMSMFFFIFYYFQYTDVCVNRKLGLN